MEASNRNMMDKKKKRVQLSGEVRCETEEGEEKSKHF